MGKSAKRKRRKEAEAAAQAQQTAPPQETSTAQALAKAEATQAEMKKAEARAKEERARQEALKKEQAELEAKAKKAEAELARLKEKKRQEQENMKRLKQQEAAQRREQEARQKQLDQQQRDKEERQRKAEEKKRAAEERERQKRVNKQAEQLFQLYGPSLTDEVIEEVLCDLCGKLARRSITEAKKQRAKLQQEQEQRQREEQRAAQAKQKKKEERELRRQFRSEEADRLWSGLMEEVIREECKYVAADVLRERRQAMDAARHSRDMEMRHHASSSHPHDTHPPSSSSSSSYHRATTPTYGEQASSHPHHPTSYPTPGNGYPPPAAAGYPSPAGTPYPGMTPQQAYAPTMNYTPSSLPPTFRPPSTDSVCSWEEEETEDIPSYLAPSGGSHGQNAPHGMEATGPMGLNISPHIPPSSSFASSSTPSGPHGSHHPRYPFGPPLPSSAYSQAGVAPSPSASGGANFAHGTGMGYPPHVGVHSNGSVGDSMPSEGWKSGLMGDDGLMNEQTRWGSGSLLHQAINDYSSPSHPYEAGFSSHRSPFSLAGLSGRFLSLPLSLSFLRPSSPSHTRSPSLLQVMARRTRHPSSLICRLLRILRVCQRKNVDLILASPFCWRICQRKCSSVISMTFSVKPICRMKSASNFEFIRWRLIVAVMCNSKIGRVCIRCYNKTMRLSVENLCE